MIVDFCGIDGSGKSTVISELLAEPRLCRWQRSVSKCDERDDRTCLTRTGRYDERSLFVSGPDAELYALAGSFDYFRYACSRTREWSTLPEDRLLFRDRSHLCFMAYCRSVSIRCGEISSALLSTLPSGDVIFWIRASPEACIDRIMRRDAGQPTDESLELLERFDAAYFEVLPLGRVHVIENSSLPAAVDNCVEVLLELSRGTTCQEIAGRR